MKEENKRLKIALIVAIILLVVDQITKIIAIATNLDITVIKDVLKLKLTFNNGVAFGIGQGKNIGTFIVSNLIVLGIIVRFIWLQKERMDLTTMYGLFIVLSGGFGNFIDRVFRGQVVDFIQIFPKIHFPVFNLADIYIVVGWVILAFTFALYSYKEILNKKKTRSKS